MEVLVRGLRARYGDAEPAVVAGRVVLQGEVEWTLKGDDSLLGATSSALKDAGISCERFGDQLLIGFGNAVGLFPIPGVGTIDVVSGKWTRNDFDVMLAEVSKVASALPFAAGQGASLPYDRSIAARYDILYHAFVYLRRVLSDEIEIDERLGALLDLVLRDPHRQFHRIRVRVPLDRASRLDATGLVRLAAAGPDVARAEGAWQGLALARALRGHLPMEVDEPRVAHSVDTDENRFVKAFLELCINIVQGMRRLIAKERGLARFAKRLYADCDRIEQTLEPTVRHPLWREVGSMVRLPVESTVLQRRRGYAGIFRHFSRLQLAARVPLDQRLVWDLLEAKDIARLYELWCYFTTVDVLTELLGAPTRADAPHIGPLQATVRWQYRVEWRTPDQRVLVLYNTSYSTGQADRHSYSVLLRPDISIEITRSTGRVVHVLDAKFRLRRLEDVVSLEVEGAVKAWSGAEQVERASTFIREDLYKMHAYRDAIGGARSAWILYPGKDLRFYGVQGATSHDASSLRWSLSGVGAAPLAPGEACTQLRSVLACLLKDGEPVG